MLHEWPRILHLQRDDQVDLSAPRPYPPPIPDCPRARKRRTEGTGQKEDTVTPDQVVEEAARGELRPIYLVLGEEVRLQTDVVRAIRDAAVRGGIPGLNDDHFTAGQSSVDAVLGAARTLPMMGARRFVLVRSLEKWEPSQSKEESPLDALAEYAEAPSPTTTLVLSAPKLDARRRLVSRAKAGGWLVSCAPLSRNELPRWLDEAARRRGNRLARGVSALIAELSGPELAPCVDALERLCLFAGEGAEVTEEHVAACVVRLRTSTVWELVSAVGRQDLAAALSALEEVYDPQDRGLRLVGVLAWSARQLVKFEAAMRGGSSPADAAKKAGAPPFKARELAEQTRRMARPVLEHWLVTLARVDRDLKGGSRRPPKAVLEHAIIELCRSEAPRRPAAGPATS